MSGTTGTFLFRVWPYLALVLAAAGFVVRLIATGDQTPAVTRAVPRVRRLFVGGRRWIAAWVLLAGAHLVGLLLPRAVLAMTRTPWMLVALEVVGFAVGLAVLAACVRSAWVHLGRPARGGWSLVADFGDAVFFTFLFIGVVSGLMAASFHRWGSQWAAVTMAPYAESLLRGRPVPAFVEHLPVLVRLHLFTTFAAIACFPASRLALLPLALAHRALAGAGRALAAAARPVRAWGRGPTAWLWPEREVRWLAKPRADEEARQPLPKAPAWLQQIGRGTGAAAKHTGGKTV
jgi:nitrate reductase gamma subunit